MFFRTLVALLAFTSIGFAGDKKPVIKLPVIGSKPLEQKEIPADSSVTLTKELVYVVESDTECLVYISKGTSVTCSKENGPLKFKAIFAGGTGQLETRKFESKYLYLFEAKADGNDEAIIVPFGTTTESQSIRINFQVGLMPQPPPIKVDPPIVVPPVVKAPIAADGLHVMIIYPAVEDNITEEQFKVIIGAKVRAALNAKCATPQAYRIWKDNTDATGDLKIWQDAYSRPRTTTPWVIISNPQKGGGYEGSMPSEADFLKLLTQYGA